MRSCDTNILLYAYHKNCLEHKRARSYMDSVVAGDFAICELVLTELYVLLRNPNVLENPMNALDAAEYCQLLRSNPKWQLIDYPGGLMDETWKSTSKNDFPIRGIYDVRLALTLKHHGVKEFATRNSKHFQGFGFKRVWNPIDD